MISLEKTKIDKIYKVVAIDTDSSIKRRFLDIGIIPNMRIQKVLQSPFGGMCAYSIIGTTIAIRDQDARGIKVIDEEV